MNSLWVPIFAVLFGVALAGYGVPAPAPNPGPYYPPGNPWYPRPPRYDSRSDSRSDSCFNSHEHGSKKCRNCKNLKTYNLNTEMEKGKTVFTYFTDKGSRKAIISCPMDGNRYIMAVEDKEDNIQHISTGTHIQRVVKCNKKGKYESIIINSDDDVTFSKVVCLKENVSRKCRLT